MTLPSANDEQISWTGTVPRSERYGDIYYSVSDGLAESQHVFLAGNRLMERFAALPDEPSVCFRVGETGFGTGLNILALWDLWKRVGFRHARLEILSVEAWPLTPSSIGQALSAFPELADLAARLVDILPPSLPGTHVIALEPGRVSLTLLYGEASNILPQHEACIDAWFLDGFAPAKNPDMWSAGVLGAIARMSRPGTTLATFTSAGTVKRGLEAEGFRVCKVAGFGRKRDMLTASLGGVTAPAISRTPWYQRPAPSSGKEAVVIGAGLAGCASARALADRGWKVTVLEKGPHLACGASGNPVGMTYLRPSSGKSPQHRYYRASWSFAIQRIRDVMLAAGCRSGEDFSLEGIVSLLTDERDIRQWDALHGGDDTDPLVDTLTAGQLASRCGGLLPATPGFLLKGAGWVNPPALCRALVAHSSIRVITEALVTGLAEDNNTGWQASTRSGTYRADTVVVANSLAARELDALSYLKMTPVRGQLTLIPASDITLGLGHVVNHETYVTPARDGLHCVGATFQPGHDDPAPRVEDDEINISGLRKALPDWPDMALHPVSSRVGIRAASSDYLPFVGPVPDHGAFSDNYRMHLRHGQLDKALPSARWLPGLFCNLAHGSRGITSSLFAAEIVSQYISGGILPTDREVLEAIHPARQLIRAWKRKQA